MTDVERSTRMQSPTPVIIIFENNDKLRGSNINPYPANVENMVNS